jgi:hypothetical protein
MSVTRRDLFRRIAATAAATGLTAETVAASADVNAKPALILFETAGTISADAADRIRDCCTHALAGTPFDGVRVLVLGDGLRVTVLDGNGRVLNRRTRTRRT